LCSEVCLTGKSAQPLGEAAQRPGGLPGAVPGDQHRPPARRDHRGGAGQLELAGLDQPLRAAIGSAHSD
jgi:hypothetical protein